MQRVNSDNPHATSNHSNVANSRKLDSVVPSCLNERIVGSNTLKRSGSPFKPPLFREATNPLESRKERQIKFRKKIQKARDVLKSFYCEPGIATEVNKYDWNTQYYSQKPTTLEKTSKILIDPDSFSVVHTFKARHKRPKSADSIGGLAEASMTSLNSLESFLSTKIAENRSHERKLHPSGHGNSDAHGQMHVNRPKTAGAINVIAKAALIDAHTAKDQRKSREILASVGMNYEELKRQYDEELLRQQSVVRYPTLETMYKHDPDKEMKLFKGTKIRLDKVEAVHKSLESTLLSSVDYSESESAILDEDPLTTGMTAKAYLKKYERTLWEASDAGLKDHRKEYKHLQVSIHRISEAEINKSRILDGKLRPRVEDDSKKRQGLHEVVAKNIQKLKGQSKSILNVIKRAKIQSTIGGMKAMASSVAGVGVKGLLAVGKRKIALSTEVVEAPKDTLRIPMTKYDNVDKSWLPKKVVDGRASTAISAGTSAGTSATVRPLSAPHRPRVKRISTDPYHFDGQCSEKREKNAYTDCIGIGDGTTIKKKKDGVHIILDDHGNLVGVALKSRSLSKRPKSANIDIFKGAGKYPLKRKIRMNNTVDAAAIKKRLKDNYGIANRDKLPRSSSVVDYEAADKRRMKTVAHNRYRMKLISDQQVLQTRDIADLCRSKDVTYYSNLTQKTKIFGQLDVEIVERNALKHIYNSMNGENWKRKDNWLTDKPLKEWHGVVTDHLGSIIELNLSNNNLCGELSPFLGDFKNLEVLILDDNQLSGPLKPNVIHNLRKLEVLSVRKNKFTDDVPLKTISECEDLRELWLSDNRFSGKCLKLELLSIGRNRISGEVPDSLKNCTKLTHLSLYGNNLSGEIPSWISLLLDLIEINLFGNNFDGDVPLRIAEEELGLVGTK